MLSNSFKLETKQWCKVFQKRQIDIWAAVKIDYHLHTKMKCVSFPPWKYILVQRKETQRDGFVLFLTCVSDSWSWLASSTLSGVERYLCASNLFSRPPSCASLNTVLAFLRRQCLPGASCWNNPGRWNPKDKRKTQNEKSCRRHQKSLIVQYTALLVCAVLLFSR